METTEAGVRAFCIISPVTFTEKMFFLMGQCHKSDHSFVRHSELKYS
jgi:hypothetical protein